MAEGDKAPVKEEPKAPKAPALSYTGSAAMAKPKKVDVLPTAARTGGPGGTSDIQAAFAGIVEERDEWFLVAEKVGNPGRFYDGFRGLGATVKVHRSGETEATDRTGKKVTVPAFDVYAMVPAGTIVPWKKASAQKKSGAGAKKGVAESGADVGEPREPARDVSKRTAS